MEIKRLGWEYDYKYGVVDIIDGEETLLHHGSIAQCYAYIKCDEEDLFQVKRKVSEVVSPVMSSRLEEEIEKVRSSEQLMYSQTEVQELLRAIKDNRQSHFQK